MRSCPAGHCVFALQLRSAGATLREAAARASGRQNTGVPFSSTQTLPLWVASSTQGSGRSASTVPRVMPNSPARAWRWVTKCRKCLVQANPAPAAARRRRTVIRPIQLQGRTGLRDQGEMLALFEDQRLGGIQCVARLERDAPGFRHHQHGGLGLVRQAPPERPSGRGKALISSSLPFFCPSILPTDHAPSPIRVKAAQLKG